MKDMKLKNMRQKKMAQSSVEYIILATVTFIIVLLIVVYISDLPSFFNLEQERKDERLYYEKLPVGIASLVAYAEGVNVTLRNNLRETIRINDVLLNNKSLGVAPELLASGDLVKLVSANFVHIPGDDFSYFITLNYTFISSNRTIINENTEFSYVGVVS